MTTLLNSFLQSLRNFINQDLFFQIVVSLAFIFFFLLLAKITSYLLRKIIKPIVEKSQTEVDDKILFIIENSSYRLITLLGIYLALLSFKDGFELVSVKTHLKLIQEYPSLLKIISVIDNLFFILLIAMLMVIASRITVVILDWYGEKLNASENKDLSGSLFPLLKKVGRLVLALCAGIIVLRKFNVDISAFVVSLGVGSLAIALAAQETLSNMISGFIIMIDRPFRIGDRIKIGNDIHGDVVGIGIRSTKILDFDKNFLILPNNDVVKSRIINLTYPNSSTRVVIDVPVGYDSDVEKVKEILRTVALADADSDKNEIPEVFVQKFGEYALEIRMTVKTDHYRNAFALGCRLREAILIRFREENIEIPFPQRVISITKSEQS